MTVHTSIGTKPLEQLIRIGGSRTKKGVEAWANLANARCKSTFNYYIVHTNNGWALYTDCYDGYDLAASRAVLNLL